MTKAIILAAGFGSRLMPLTANVPKTMVEYKGKKLIEYEIEALQSAGIKEIAVVGGYKFEVLKTFLQNRFGLNAVAHRRIGDNQTKIRFFENKNYANTNMLHSLFCAREFLCECINQKQDIIISYADIVYFTECVKSLLDTKGEFAICVDKQWQKLWEARFDDILSDAETLKMQKDSNGEFYITELGKKPKTLNDIEAQYMGLFRFSHDFLDKVIALYDSLDKNAIFDSQPYNNIYMTSFLQELINKYHNAKAVIVNGNWCEIDFKSDLEIDIDLLNGDS